MTGIAQLGTCGYCRVHALHWYLLRSRKQSSSPAPQRRHQPCRRQPSQAWAGDITYIRTWEGWLYLAVIIDLYSRRVVGWGLGSDLHRDLVLKALKIALGLRQPGEGLVHHSDRGSQYASAEYRRFLEAHEIRMSMSRKGDCWDNAVVESFFGTLKSELIHRYPWPTRRAARAAIIEYIEVFYNRHRRHSYLGYLSPADFEEAAEKAAEAA